MVSSYPKPPSRCENYNRSCREPDLQATPLGHNLFTQFNKFVIARAAGAEMIQPLVDLHESQLVECDAS
jgi:hypothetical protein